MTQDITQVALTRYTTKAYDPTKKVSDQLIEQVKLLLRYSPSSVNAQPWHFVLAATDKGKARIAKSMERSFSFNQEKVLDASHVVVFCSRLHLQPPYLLHVLEQEEKDGRFAQGPKFKEGMHAGRNRFVNLHQQDLQDEQHWMEKQVYLNVGAFLLGVAALGIDATPMEGVDAKVLDAELGLREQGFASVVVVPLGYHDPEKDSNATLPKSRLPVSEILTEI